MEIINNSDTSKFNQLILEDVYDVGGLALSTGLIADIDSDNELEIVYGGYSKFLVFNFSDGAFHLEDEHIGSMVGITHSSPAIADIDDDGFLEIPIGSASDKIHVFSHNGHTIIEEGSYDVGSDIESPIAIGDLDNDSELEIICTENDPINGMVHIFNHSHNHLSLEASYNLGNKAKSGACIADFDNDDNLEFSITDFDGDLYIFEHTGSELIMKHLWNSGISEWTSPSCADLNNDGDLEIAFGSNNHNMYLFDDSLNIIDSITTDGGFETSPILSDIDFDGEIEIIYAGPGVFICNFSNGNLIIEDSVTNITGIYSSPAIGDIDNDNITEIMFGSNDDFFYIFEYMNNSIVFESSYQTNDDVFSSPIFADIDNDGKTEIFIGSEDHFLYAFEVGGEHNYKSFDWGQFAYNNENTGFVPLIDDLILNVIYVDDDYNSLTKGWQIDHFDTIQDGIGAVAENGSIYVLNGYYNESIMINKSINLIGANKEQVTISGNKPGYATINVYTNNIHIEEFTVTKGNEFVDIGLRAHSISTIMNLSIEDCIFIDTGEAGISLSICDNSIIQNCQFYNSFEGIQLDRCPNTIIKRCSIVDNLFGISLFESYNSIIISNDILNCSNYGITTQDSDNCIIYHNNFINNAQNAYDPGINQWDNDYPSGGNYWNDYSGVDINGDGIGDTSHPISGGLNSDRYPFMNENGWIRIDVNQSQFNRGFPIRHALDGDWGGAQNFITTGNTLNKIDLYIRKFGIPEFNLTVELRKDSINGNLLATYEFLPSDIESIWQWLTIDLGEIMVNQGVSYFIICPPAPSDVSTSFGYEWGYAFGNQYDDGAFWFTRDGGELWRDLPTMYEFVFRTFKNY